MKKPQISITFILSLLILVTIFLIPENSFAQKKKQQQLAREKFEMDALALAYSRCKLDLLRYESAQKPENKNLMKELANFASLEARFNNHVWMKYQTQEEREKMDKEIKNANKKLSVCIKYQNIQDALAREKEKANSAKKE
ncbi:MAG: hypothetical protein GXO86_08535 [Chlorobi bacterium]|nr:hypothetical protein [Chlorobiota bacterium]